MQAHDPPPNPSSPNQNTLIVDQPTMNGEVSIPINAQNPSPPPLESEATSIRKNEVAETAQSNGEAEIKGEKKENGKIESKKSSNKSSKNGGNDVVVARKERPTRACTVRAKLYAEPPLIELRSRPTKKEKVKVAAVVVKEAAEEEEEKDAEDSGKGQFGKIITPLLNEPPPGQIPRWNLRAMWELGSILNFFNVFRPLLNITVEFSAEEFETSLITPNDTLSYIHIPLLKAIPPVTRMACGRETWVTVLCRKLRDWWHWVAEGDLPIVAAHGAEIEAYKTLEPAVRVVILKALCDIRVQQEDIRSYIDDRMKHGIHLSTFRKERIGGDSHGVSYWYEDDVIVGHRLYRETRKVEMKKAKIKGSSVLPSTTYEWETVATNLDEFQVVSEKLFSSKNRTEASLGKKLKNDFLPEIEKIHKRKEKLLKKQQREALLLDSFVNMDGFMAGRSLRDRKPVTYTFDAFDRSINEAIKITKQKQSSPEPGVKREAYGRSEPSANGTWSEPSHAPDNGFFSPPSPPDYDDEMDQEDRKSQELLDRSDRRRRRPQRYSEKEFIDEVSENDRNSDSDDDIVGEAVYDEEYLKRKKRKRTSSGSEGDEEYHWSEENGEEEEEEEEDYSSSMSDDSDSPRKSKKLPGRTRKETKSRLADDLQSGLRRSKRSTRNRINYQHYEVSESDPDSAKQDKLNASPSYSAGSDKEEFTMESPDSNAHGDRDEMAFDIPLVEEGYPVNVDEKLEHPDGPSYELNSANPEMGEVRKARFLDLNEAAPGSSFDDGPSALMKDGGKNDS